MRVQSCTVDRKMNVDRKINVKSKLDKCVLMQETRNSISEGGDIMAREL